MTPKKPNETAKPKPKHKNYNPKYHKKNSFPLSGSDQDPKDKTSMALKKLTEPFKEKWYIKLWENLTTQLTGINKLGIIISFVVAIGITAVITMFIIPKGFEQTKMEDAKFGILQRLEGLKQSHNYYTKMATKDELLVSWIKQFSEWTYKLGGDTRNNSGDCSGAVFQFLRSWGANVNFGDVKSIVSLAENLAARGELKIRKNISEVRSGDIIVTQQSSSNPIHVGIIYDTANGYVRYIDVNSIVQGMGFEKQKFDSAGIYAIYEVSYSMWVGDLMQKINNM